MNASPEASEPTQDQLRNIRDTVLGHETIIEPFDGIPPGIDLTKFKDLAAPPTFDETSAPATILRAPDRRTIWLSVFRNPDTNVTVKQAITIVDPRENRSERDELPQENYEIREDPLGKLAIKCFNAPAMTSAEVSALQEFINLSEVFDPLPR